MANVISTYVIIQFRVNIQFNISTKLMGNYTVLGIGMLNLNTKNMQFYTILGYTGIGI